MSLAANFIGGAAGSVLEQKIGSGSVSLKESIVSGAATAGIRYLARDWDDGGSDLAGSVLGLVQGIGQMAISPYAKNRDPRRGCGAHSSLSNRVGEPMTYGYRYDVGSLKSAGSVRGKKDGFSMLGLLKEAVIGGVMGGLAGTAFYGAGKAFGFLKDSVRDGEGYNPKVDNITKQAREWLGKDVRVVTNKNGDKVFMSNDATKRLRFDINNTSPHNNPHGHVEEFIDGKWIKSGSIYPTDVPHN